MKKLLNSGSFVCATLAACSGKTALECQAKMQKLLLTGRKIISTSRKQIKQFIKSSKSATSSVDVPEIILC